MKLIDVLLKIASKFNKEDVTWAVGGSLLLYFYDIVDEPKDIDIIVEPEDQNKVFRILNGMGKAVETEEVPKYKTLVFGKYDVEGIEVDIIGDFYIKTSKGYYLHPFQSEDLKIIHKNNVKIYLDSIENWVTTYKAMGDPKDRVKSIENYLNN